MVNRRGFLAAMGASITGATFDHERLLWKPKLISIPKPRPLTIDQFSELYIRTAVKSIMLFYDEGGLYELNGREFRRISHAVPSVY